MNGALTRLEMNNQVKCRFPGCTRTSKDIGVRFFNFRRHDYQKWCEICHIDHTKYKMNTIVNRGCSGYFKICSDHFYKYDLEMAVGPYVSKSKLKKNVVPKCKGETKN